MITVAFCLLDSAACKILQLFLASKAIFKIECRKPKKKNNYVEVGFVLHLIIIASLPLCALKNDYKKKKKKSASSLHDAIIN